MPKIFDTHEDLKCPCCGRNNNQALGHEPPKSGAFVICAYCTAINVYKITDDGVHELRPASELDIQRAIGSGIYDHMLATQDFLKQRNKYRN